METQKIYWPMDPYADNRNSWQSVSKVLSAVQKKTGAKVYPIHFLDERHIHWYGHSNPQKIEPLKQILREVMKSHLEKFPSVVWEAPEVVFTETLSKRGSAKFVARFLEVNQADLVVLNTHARKGIKRAFVGSFAESLLWSCRTPQIIISPKAQGIEKVDKVFYPTDTSDKSFQLFRRFLELDLAQNIEICLYSKIVSPSETYAKAMTTALGGGWMTLGQYDLKEEKRIEENLGAWVSLAIEKGHKADVFVDSSEGSLSDRIVEVAREKGVDLIAMPTFTSQLDAMLVGSHSIEVIRESEIPVWVQHFQ